jgi:acyl-CoA thioester hydrolase
MRELNRSDYAHLTPIQVKWGEMDSLGHVNNTVFFRYSEDGRIDYIHRVTAEGDGASQSNGGPILADLQCSFLLQLRFPADIEIGTRASRLGRSSLNLEQCLFRVGSEEAIAVFKNVIVWFDFGAQTSMRIPETIREQIRRLEHIPPEE